MVLAIIKRPGEYFPELWTMGKRGTDSWDAFHAATFSPEAETLAAVSTEISGTDYQSRKQQASGILWDLQNAASVPGLSMGELATIREEAEKIARRAGLLREARENGIC